MMLDLYFALVLPCMRVYEVGGLMHVLLQSSA